MGEPLVLPEGVIKLFLFLPLARCPLGRNPSVHLGVVLHRASRSHLGLGSRSGPHLRNQRSEDALGGKQILVLIGRDDVADLEPLVIWPRRLSRLLMRLICAY